MTEYDFLISGALSGAITDPYSDKATLHAKKYYAAIRKFSTDVDKIAQNTGYNRSQVLLVKNYLFLDTHELETGIRRFDPDFYIAESWRRLAFDPEHIQPHDVMLLKHELNEMHLITQGYSQRKAHDMTNESGLNYQKMCEEYYHKLEEKQVHKDINAGAVFHKKKPHTHR